MPNDQEVYDADVRERAIVPTDGQRAIRLRRYARDKATLDWLIRRGETAESNFNIALSRNEVLALARLLRHAEAVATDHFLLDRRVEEYRTYAD